MAAIKCSRRKTLVRDTSKTSIRKCILLDSLETTLVLYRFSEPVVRVERKKRFEKDNNYVDAFFQLVLGYID